VSTDAVQLDLLEPNIAGREVEYLDAKHGFWRFGQGVRIERVKRVVIYVVRTVMGRELKLAPQQVRLGAEKMECAECHCMIAVGQMVKHSGSKACNEMAAYHRQRIPRPCSSK
jgi:hypothetical protein